MQGSGSSARAPVHRCVLSAARGDVLRGALWIACWRAENRFAVEQSFASDLLKLLERFERNAQLVNTDAVHGLETEAALDAQANKRVVTSLIRSAETFLEPLWT